MGRCAFLLFFWPIHSNYKINLQFWTEKNRYPLIYTIFIQFHFYHNYLRRLWIFFELSHRINCGFSHKLTEKWYKVLEVTVIWWVDIRCYYFRWKSINNIIQFPLFDNDWTPYEMVANSTQTLVIDQVSWKFADGKWQW